MRTPAYEHKLYYGIHCDNPLAKPGDLALHTWAGDELTRQMEVNAGRRRPDIGLIKELNIKAGHTEWIVVYDETKECDALDSSKQPV